MISTGTFLSFLVDAIDTNPIPVILGNYPNGYFVCLPDHDAAFILSDILDVDTDCFTCYMDGANASLVADAVKHAISFLDCCYLNRDNRVLSAEKIMATLIFNL